MACSVTCLLLLLLLLLVLLLLLLLLLLASLLLEGGRVVAGTVVGLLFGLGSVGISVGTGGLPRFVVGAERGWWVLRGARAGAEGAGGIGVVVVLLVKLWAVLLGCVSLGCTAAVAAAACAVVDGGAILAEVRLIAAVNSTPIPSATPLLRCCVAAPLGCLGGGAAFLPRPRAGGAVFLLRVVPLL